MFTKQSITEIAMSSVVGVLIFLATAGQCAKLVDDLDSTLSPSLSKPMLITQAVNESVEEPRVLRLHQPCRAEHANYCQNGGQCMYPQDTNIPNCRCKPSYNGQRCMFLLGKSQTLTQYEEVIGISAAVGIILLILIVCLCCVRKRCMKSALLMKSKISESCV